MGKNRFEVLISCMNETGFDIVDRSNLNCNCCIINQCDTDGHSLKKEDGKIANKFDMSERGLSKSRNAAIERSQADIVLLGDNDEVFPSNLEEIVVNTYDQYSDSDVIVFDVGLKIGDKETLYKKGAKETKILNKFSVLKVSSVQISFKRESVVKKGIRFDENFGSGSPGGGGGEENIFLEDCLRNGLKIRYVPEKIATLVPENSTWFSGWNEAYFFSRGQSTRRILGFFWAFVYAFYFILSKRKLYIKEINSTTALCRILKGIISDIYTCDEYNTNMKK